jgi:hypothetical protein
MTARGWLDAADFDNLNEELHARFVERVGYDKADEVRAALKRIAENLLDSLGDMLLTETSMLKLITLSSSVAIDNYLPHERPELEDG